MDYLFECSITPLRKYILDLEEKTEKIFAGFNEKLIHQIRMVIMELLENAEKYSTIKCDDTNIKFKFNANDNEITIRVSNCILAPEHYENLTRIIKQIQSAENIEALYISRLQELALNKNLSESGLGLYRIAYEGEFQLECDREAEMVTVSAHRRLE